MSDSVPVPPLSGAHPAALISECVKSLENSKALNPVCIDVSHNSSLADFMLICSGTSSRHVCSAAEKLVEYLYKRGIRQLTVSGERQGEWVIVDAGSVIIHILQPEARERYQLEELYRCMGAGTTTAEIIRA